MNIYIIRTNTLFALKIIWRVLLLLLGWAGTLLLIVLSSPIWLPIVLWKTGLIVSDHIMKQITDA